MARTASRPSAPARSGCSRTPLGHPGISTVTFNWDVVELPKGPSGHMGNWLFWGAYVVNKNTKY